MSASDKPAEGDRYRCQECEMEVLVTQPCNCENGEPFFSCCDKKMEKV